MPGDRIVYSTDAGRIDQCPNCGRATKECVCRSKSVAKRPDEVVRVFRDRKNRRGKTVTAITGVPGHEGALLDLAKTLKQMCGTGGTVKDRVIEIQGDHREAIAAKLTALGYRVKLAGG